MKNLQLTDTQYKQLVKLAFIGEWVLNAQSVTPEFPEEADLVNYLYSKCKEFGAEDWFDSFEMSAREEGDWEFKQDQVEGMLPVIEEFSENYVYPILVQKLAARDLIKTLAFSDLEKFDRETIDPMLEEIEEFYINEFELNDIENLHLVFDEVQSEN